MKRKNYKPFLKENNYVLVQYNFNKTTNTLETKFSEKVTLNEIINYIQSTKNNKKNPRTLKILTDTSTAIFNFSIENLGRIVEENNKSLEKYNCIIDAIIVDNPKNTVLTVLYKELAKTPKYQFKIFATKNAAKKWLNIF
ncbi:hypothetical protein SAMN05444411_10179 [Lutibacter oricola]|uniref:SpoIIAA-like n=1 Tax=Lutibacter oricola TaxID=762486 RepID=A0A1H2QTU7_9FLAO|nr:hypothetical protein [Lutibacter oricola]SDW10545.1 hypothetical protein SAMN05444411_10179 [Lutibacter oricola]